MREVPAFNGGGSSRWQEETMKGRKFLFSAFVMLLILSLGVTTAGAQEEPPVVQDTTPYPISPMMESVFTKLPKFTFTEAPGATKYRIQVFNNHTGALVYTYKGGPACDGGECWLKPDIALKYLDCATTTGWYSWHVMAKIAGKWQSAYSDSAFFSVLSSGFDSSFDTLNKWSVVFGAPWTIVYNKGYAKTLGLSSSTSSIIQKFWFTDGIVYEVMMKRKLEPESSNRLFILGETGDPTSGGIWQQGYVFEYYNSGEYNFFKQIDWDKTFFYEDLTTTAIVPNGWNKLTVWVKDGEISLWINETFIGTVADTEYTEGCVGIGMYEKDTTEKSPLLVDWATLKYSDTAPYTIP